MTEGLYWPQVSQDAKEVVQRMLSRKKLLAAEGLNISMQASQQQQTALIDPGPVAKGTLGQNMVAALLNGSGLTEEELSLVTEAVQQVVEEHMVSSPTSKQIHASSSCYDNLVQQQAATMESPDQPQQQSSQDGIVYATANSLAASAQAGLAPHSISEIMKAEHELELELMQLANLQSRKFEPSATQAAASMQTPAMAVQPPATVTNGAYSQGGSNGDALTADMLSAVLEDPDASVDDIMNILSYVMSQKKPDNLTASAGSPGQPCCSNSAYDHGVQQLEDQQPQLSVSAAAAAANGTAAECNSSATEAADPICSSSTASELAARLLQQARAKHGLAEHRQAVGSPDYHTSNSAHQATCQTISPWHIETEPRYNKGVPHTAILHRSSPVVAAGHGSAASLAYRNRSSSPTGSQKHFHAGYGSYAELANARVGRRDVVPAQGQWPGITTADMDKAWGTIPGRGLQHKGGPQGISAGAQLAGGARDGTAARVLPEFGACQAQEWLGYDGLLGLSSTAQRQEGNADSAAECTIGVGQYRAKFTPELDAKLQQLYGRNVDWKRRCEEVYARQRRAEQEAELKDCTFAPTINKKSAKIVQKVRLGFTGRPGSALSAPHTPLYQQKQLQRSASTGKLSLRAGFHEEYAAKEDQIICSSKQAAQDSAMRAASAVAAVLGEEAGRQLMQEMLGRELVAIPAADADNETPVTSGTGSADAADSSKATRSGSSSPKRAWLLQDAALRLYEDAFVKKERAASIEREIKAVERKARSWSAPRCPAYRDIAPRVYEHLSPGRGSSSPSRRREGSAPPDCTFKPQTNSCSHKFPRKHSSSIGGKHTAPLRSPAVQRSTTGGTSCRTVRRLDDEFKTAVESIMHEQQKLDVGIRQLLNSTDSSRSADGGEASSTNNGSGAGGHDLANTARPSSAPANGSASSRDDAGWKEFISRQGMFLLVKEAKAAQIAAQLSRPKKPQVSPGSKRILKEKERSQTERQLARVSPLHIRYRHCTPYPMGLAAGVHGGCDLPENVDSSPGGSSSAGSLYLDRVQQQMQVTQQVSPAGSSNGKQQQGKKADWGRFSFKPIITTKAAAKKPRSFDDMSEGDRLRREAKLEQLRILEEARRLAGVTFSPDLSPTRSRRCNTTAAAAAEACSSGDDSTPHPYQASAGRVRSPSMAYECVKPRIQLKGPGLEAYLNSLELKRRELEEKRKKTEEKRKKEEMAECTFKPITTPVPAYLKAWASMGYAARFSESKTPHTTIDMVSGQQQQQVHQQQFEQWTQTQKRHLHTD